MKQCNLFCRDANIHLSRSNQYYTICFLQPTATFHISLCHCASLCLFKVIAIWASHCENGLLSNSRNLYNWVITICVIESNSHFNMWRRLHSSLNIPSNQITKHSIFKLNIERVSLFSSIRCGMRLFNKIHWMHASKSWPQTPIW